VTHRNEEWARRETTGEISHLHFESVDESVRVLPDLLRRLGGKVDPVQHEAGTGQWRDGAEHHSDAVTLTYRTWVDLIWAAGWRPIDLATREPIDSWRPSWQTNADHPAPTRQEHIGPPETKA
jgi:hypothetical protein